MEIRLIRPDEWAALKALRLQALASDPGAFGGRLDDAIEHDDDLWRKRAAADPAETTTFVAEGPDGHLVGMAVGARIPERADAAGLFGMWVAPEARGRGVATTNIGVVAFYERKGFAVLGEPVPMHEGSSLQMLRMVATLDAVIGPPSS
jgi:GNAT superfamily N-acetyltransferase